MATKRLTKDMKRAMIAGVCSGIAKYTDQDPTVIRLIYVLLLFLTGIIPMVFVYIIFAIIMPEK
ncbi:MAG: PspC domain-containing protein [Candidatus Woesearchaeota archaeon]